MRRKVIQGRGRCARCLWRNQCHVVGFCPDYTPADDLEETQYEEDSDQEFSTDDEDVPARKTRSFHVTRKW